MTALTVATPMTAAAALKYVTVQAVETGLAAATFLMVLTSLIAVTAKEL